MMLKHTNFFIVILIIFFSTAQLVNANQDSVAYEEALRSFHSSDFEETIIHLKNSLKDDVNHIPSRILLAETLLELGNGAAAETELLDLQAEGVDLNRLVTLIAKSLILQNKYDEALEVANVGYRGRDVESDILFLRGQSYLGLNQIKLADNAFTDALSISPSHQKAILGKAQIAVSKNNLELAMRHIDKALEFIQQWPNAWIMKSVVAQSTGDDAMALNAITRALEISPNHLQARLSRASILFSQSDHKQALEDLDFILKEIPNEPRAKYLKAIINATTGDPVNSQKYMSEVLITLSSVPQQIMENNPIYLYLAGVTNFQYGNLEEAQGYLRNYLSQNEQDLDALELLATIALRQGDINSAKNILTKANLYFPNQPSILTKLGIVMMEQGSPEIAQRYFEQVTSISPNFTGAKLNLARSKMAEKKYDEAIEELVSVRMKSTQSFDDIESYLLLIDAYLKVNKFENANNLSTELVSLYPKSGYFAQKHATVLGLSGDIEGSKVYLRRATKLSPDNITPQVSLARIAILEGKPRQALEIIDELHALYTDNVSLVIELAEVYLALGEIEKSHQYFEKAFSLDTKREETAQKLVSSFMRQGLSSEAESILVDYTKRVPQASKSRLMLGDLYLIMNQPKKAVESLSSAISSMEDRIPAYISLSRAYLALDDRERAVKSLNKAIAWSEERLEPYLALFPIVLSQNDFERAEQVIFSINLIQPEIALVELYAGRLSMVKEEFREAEKHFQNAHKKEPSSGAVLGLFHALNKQGRYKTAQKTVAKWLKSAPNDIVIELALAESFSLIGQPEKVIPFYDQLIKKYRRMPLVLNNAANAYFIVGKKEEAHALANEAYNKAGENVAVIDTLAWIESRQGNHAAALSLFRDALVIDFNNPDIKYHLAMTLKKENRDVEAKKTLIEVLNNDREFSEREAAEALLKEWQGR